ncbi:ABC transporter ATP-binding protein [Microlunatus soli]|uniref:Energy-coupling factor transport system ATP-binding protein n=1 Tax=Microlunatus soli TaxID=630515 RepID=A0A1H1Z9P5_9ACTN|nr:ATP-binding cassette domain-containing protein [Microlunatus soli]SDT30373.1 energy-coupling factor transport system ATP-binding protein [Microlunatus soli]
MAAGPPPSRVRLQGFGFRHLIRPDWAVRGIDLRIEPGERVLLLGPSGAGKSTLLHAIAGLLDSETGDVEGSITVDGAAPTPASGGHGLSRTGIVFQDPDSQLVMNRCGDEVAFGLENAGVPREQIWPRVRRALAAVGFRYPLDRPTRALSGGERQRLVLAGVLALDPGLLLLDEPTANLDPDGAEQVIDAIAAVTADRSATMIMIEHRITPVLALVDRVVVIDPAHGVIADGDPQRVLAEQHDRLAANGVWVDDRLPWSADRAAARSGVELLRVEAPQRRYAADGPLLPGPVELSITAGSVTGIIGPNGVGKSTLAGMLSGLAAPQLGVVAPSAELVSGMRPRTAARPIRRWPSEQLAARIGTVFQNPEHQFLTGRVADEVALGPRHSRRAYAERADELLERLGLAGLADANPFTLSGGEKRRLSVATALAGRPRVVILDEPTFGQDRRTWIELARLFSELADDGIALVCVSHDRLLIRALPDQIIALTRPEDDRAAAVPEVAR